MSGANLDRFDVAVLQAVLEGARGRAGVKERLQALTEYEIARRVGIVAYSYVEFANSPEREALRTSLSRLQRHGLVQVASFSGKYEQFQPTERTESALTPHSVPPPGPALESSAEVSLPTTFEGKLDEIIHLLRSIDARLERSEQRRDR